MYDSAVCRGYMCYYFQPTSAVIVMGVVSFVCLGIQEIKNNTSRNFILKPQVPIWLNLEYINMNMNEIFFFFLKLVCDNALWLDKLFLINGLAIYIV